MSTPIRNYEGSELDDSGANIEFIKSSAKTYGYL